MVIRFLFYTYFRFTSNYDVISDAINWSHFTLQLLWSFSRRRCFRLLALFGLAAAGVMGGRRLATHRA